MMKLNLASLLEEPVGSEMRFDIDEAQQELAEDLHVDFVRGNIAFTRTDTGISASGQLHSQVQLACARCLETFSHPLDFDLEAKFSLPPIKPQGEAIYPIALQSTLDLTEALREHILLNLPMRPLCKSNCSGLCTECGKNLNEETCDCVKDDIDPRLAKLKDLL